MEPKIPLASCRASAGFPSPADDHIDEGLNLHSYVVRNPAATFFVRAAGDSMTGAGIFPGDILVVDRSTVPRPGNVVIAVVEGAFTVKRLTLERGSYRLTAESATFKGRDILLGEGNETSIWGVVTFAIHKFT